MSTNFRSIISDPPLLARELQRLHDDLERIKQGGVAGIGASSPPSTPAPSRSRTLVGIPAAADPLTQKQVYVNPDGTSSQPSGMISSIAVAAPITGGGSGGAVSIGHAASGVTPNSYTNTNLTVDADGHITAASNGSGGTGVLSATELYAASSTPAQITSNQNDYALPAAATFIRLSCDANRNITGLVASTNRVIIIMVIGSFQFTFKNEDAASSAANRIITSGGGDQTVGPNNSLRLWYDDVSSRWRMF